MPLLLHHDLTLVVQVAQTKTSKSAGEAAFVTVATLHCDVSRVGDNAKPGPQEPLVCQHLSSLAGQTH